MVWIYMFVVDWRTALLAILPFPVGMCLMITVFIGYSKNYARSVEITSAMNDSLIEYTGGIEVIKAYNQGGESYATLKERCIANATFFYNWMKECKCNIYAMIIAPTTLLSILPFGWLFYNNGSLSFKEFVTTIILSLCLMGPVLAVMDFVDTLAKVGTVVENVNSVLSAKEQDHSGNESFTGKDEDIEFKDVGFAYT